MRNKKEEYLISRNSSLEKEVEQLKAEKANLELQLIEYRNDAESVAADSKKFLAEVLELDKIYKARLEELNKSIAECNEILSKFKKIYDINTKKYQNTIDKEMDVYLNTLKRVAKNYGRENNKN